MYSTVRVCAVCMNTIIFVISSTVHNDDFPRVITESKVITQCMNNENYTTGGHQNKVSFFHYFRRECCICNFSLNGQCNAILPSGFFIPQVPIIPLGSFQIFVEIRRDIRSSRFTTGGKWKKIFNQKSFKYLIWTPSGSRVNI